jgi:hypothetical protein
MIWLNGEATERCCWGSPSERWNLMHHRRETIRPYPSRVWRVMAEVTGSMTEA